jgi:predicted NBD/HSP70 family sugar kinase
MEKAYVVGVDIGGQTTKIGIVDRRGTIVTQTVIGSKYKAGEHLDLDFITYKKCRNVHIESDEPIGVCADGEVTMETVIDVEVVPAALSFSIPEGCELAALSAEIAPEEEISVDSPENEEATI